MYTLRCTQKLLRRIAGALPDSTAAPTTHLGDWYANILFSKPQHLVLCVSERTLLPIVIPAREIQLLPLRLADGVRDVLVALGIDPSLAEQEWQEMQSCQFGKTASKRILGSQNDFMFHLKWCLEDHPSDSLLQQSLTLAQMPSKVLAYNSPDAATRELFGAASSTAPELQ